MQTILTPYINFKGNARQAMEFYHSVFGGELKVSTFKEYNASQDPAEDNLVMHSALEAGPGRTLMASDMPARMEYRPGTNFGVTLSGDDEVELTKYFNKLSEGGAVSVPLAKATWGNSFGMCTDRFGINWMVNISPSS